LSPRENNQGTLPHSGYHGYGLKGAGDGGG